MIKLPDAVIFASNVGNKKMKQKITIICVCAFLTVNVFAQNFGEFEKTVQAELLERNAVGADVEIVKNDQVIFAKFQTSLL